MSDKNKIIGTTGDFGRVIAAPIVDASKLSVVRLRWVLREVDGDEVFFLQAKVMGDENERFWIDVPFAEGGQ